MRIALILPKYSVSIHDPCCFPLGFMSISAVLKQAGHDVTVFNLNLYDDLNYITNMEFSIRTSDAVLFTGFEEFAEENKMISAWARSKGIHTVLGGALATFAPEEMLQHFDTVVVGEGEAVIETALTSCGIIQGTKPDLDALPSPDYEGFGIAHYNELHSIRYMGVLTSRGCPYSCRFCAQTCSFQFRSLPAVFEEIDHYRATYGVQHIVFNDNTLNLRKDRFLAICEGMKERGLTWSAAIRVDVFDEEMTRAAKESGCGYFVVGVESFNDGKLAAMGKRITAAQITAALDLLHQHEICYHGNVLLGLPGETYDDIVAELDFLPQKYNVFPVLVQPFIGTEYRERSITEEEADYLSEVFREFAEARGMNVYREAA
jgi:radical SAM superfamily enzyme YgiQ (UPF0313 family)